MEFGKKELDLTADESPGGESLAGVLDGEPAIGEKEISEAMAILEKYKSAKASLDKRIIDNEEWYKLGHWKQYGNRVMEGKRAPSTGWLFNSIANKHADAMDNYPEPNVLPRAQDDEETARLLSDILPVVLEQADYEAEPESLTITAGEEKTSHCSRRPVAAREQSSPARGDFLKGVIMSKATNAAREQLDAWEARKPEDYTSKYKDRIDGVMGQLDGMKDFSYDPTRDAAYEQYKNSYTRQAKLANENAQANASAISGGYGSSYGTQAGQSAYQNAMAGLSNATNGLYSQALNQYTQKKSDLQSQLSGYQQAEAQDYEKYQTNYQNWENQRNYYQSMYNQAVSESQAKKSRSTSIFGTILSVAASLLPFLL